MISKLRRRYSAAFSNVISAENALFYADFFMPQICVVFTAPAFAYLT